MSVGLKPHSCSNVKGIVIHLPLSRLHPSFRVILIGLDDLSLDLLDGSLALRLALRVGLAPRLVGNAPHFRLHVVRVHRLGFFSCLEGLLVELVRLFEPVVALRLAEAGEGEAC